MLKILRICPGHLVRHEGGKAKGGRLLLKHMIIQVQLIIFQEMSLIVIP